MERVDLDSNQRRGQGDPRLGRRACPNCLPAGKPRPERQCGGLGWSGLGVFPAIREDRGCRLWRGSRISILMKGLQIGNKSSVDRISRLPEPAYATLQIAFRPTLR
jgi:hypothetical protein